MRCSLGSWYVSTTFSLSRVSHCLVKRHQRLIRCMITNMEAIWPLRSLWNNTSVSFIASVRSGRCVMWVRQLALSYWLQKQRFYFCWTFVEWLTSRTRFPFTCVGYGFGVGSVICCIGLFGPGRQGLLMVGHFLRSSSHCRGNSMDRVFVSYFSALHHIAGYVTRCSSQPGHHDYKWILCQFITDKGYFIWLIGLPR